MNRKSPARLLIWTCILCLTGIVGFLSLRSLLAPPYRLEVVQVRDGKTITRLKSNRILSLSESLVSAAISADGHRLTTVSSSGRIKIWNVDTGRLLQSQQTRIHDISSATSSPTGRLVALCTGEGEASELTSIGIWDTLRKCKVRFAGPAAPEIPCYYAFSPDGSHIALQCSDGAIRIYDTKGAVVQTLTPAYEITDMVFSPDGLSLAAYVHKPTQCIIKWRLSDGKITDKLQTKGGPVAVSCFSSNGKAIFADSLTHSQLAVWRIGNRTPQLVPSSGHIFLTANDASFLAQDRDGKIYLRRMEDGQPTWSSSKYASSKPSVNHTDLRAYSKTDRVAVFENTIYKNRTSRSKIIAESIASGRTLFVRPSAYLLDSDTAGDRIVVCVEDD